MASTPYICTVLLAVTQLSASQVLSVNRLYRAALGSDVTFNCSYSGCATSIWCAIWNHTDNSSFFSCSDSIPNWRDLFNATVHCDNGLWSILRFTARQDLNNAVFVCRRLQEGPASYELPFLLQVLSDSPTTSDCPLRSSSSSTVLTTASTMVSTTAPEDTYVRPSSSDLYTSRTGVQSLMVEVTAPPYTQMYSSAYQSVSSSPTTFSGTPQVSFQTINVVGVSTALAISFIIAMVESIALILVVTFVCRTKRQRKEEVPKGWQEYDMNVITNPQVIGPVPKETQAASPSE